MPHPLYVAVAQRADHYCEYCRAPERLSGYAFEVEHIIPTARGGANNLDNTALAGGLCNRAKGVRVQARDPQTGVVVPLFNPRQDDWRDHFTWRVDFTVIEGLTPTGRATVAALRLNTVRRRDARVFWRALSEIGIGEPPFQWP